MSLAERIKSFAEWSRPLRKAFGSVNGTRVAMGIRRATWAAPAGTLVGIAVPHWKHPVWLRAGTSDAAVFLQVFADRQGFFPVPGNPRLVVDAGANIGLTSVCLANRFPQSDIVALEVDQGNFNVLKKNCLPYSNITPLHLGLWSHSANLLVENPDSEAWAFHAKEVAAGTPGAIPAVGIADLLRQLGRSHIDVLKIDIEGAEYDVFSRGLSKWIDKVSTVAVEVHESVRSGVTEMVVSSMAEREFSVRRWGEYWLFARP